MDHAANGAAMTPPASIATTTAMLIPPPPTDTSRDPGCHEATAISAVLTEPTAYRGARPALEQERRYHRAPRSDEPVGQASGGRRQFGSFRVELLTLVRASAAFGSSSVATGRSRLNLQRIRPAMTRSTTVRTGFSLSASTLASTVTPMSAPTQPGIASRQDQSSVDVVEPPVGDRGRQAGSDFGQVDGGRHSCRRQAGAQKDAGRGGPEAHAERAVDERGSKTARKTIQSSSMSIKLLDFVDSV